MACGDLDWIVEGDFGERFVMLDKFECKCLLTRGEDIRIWRAESSLLGSNLDILSGVVRIDPAKDCSSLSERATVVVLEGVESRRRGSG